jgi:hypothetical protein
MSQMELAQFVIFACSGHQALKGVINRVGGKKVERAVFSSHACAYACVEKE